MAMPQQLRRPHPPPLQRYPVPLHPTWESHAFEPKKCHYITQVSVIGSHKARIRFESMEPRELTLPIDALRHIDYGYTVTSFSSQGSTVDKVVINDDSMRSLRLVNREEEYVSVSRARIDARIYTDDAQAL